jgi:hypothetical protein
MMSTIIERFVSFIGRNKLEQITDPKVQRLVKGSYEGRKREVGLPITICHPLDDDTLKIHVNEVYGHKVYGHEVYGHEVHAYEMHACEMHGAVA